MWCCEIVITNKSCTATAYSYVYFVIKLHKLLSIKSCAWTCTFPSSFSPFNEVSSSFLLLEPPGSAANDVLPPVPHLLLQRLLLKVLLQHTKGRLKISWCVSRACTCSDRTGGRLNWNKLIYWIIFPLVEADRECLTLHCFVSGFGGHLPQKFGLFLHCAAEMLTSLRAMQSFPIRFDTRVRFRIVLRVTVLFLFGWAWIKKALLLLFHITAHVVHKPTLNSKIHLNSSLEKPFCIFHWHVAHYIWHTTN